jgi:stage V sporulation protein AE
MDYVKAFFVGGAICAVVQIVIDKTKLMPGRVMVILVCIGAVLGSIRLGSKEIYEAFGDWAGAAASVPLTGFGNILYQGVKDAVDKDGLLGIFKGGFTASAVGVSAALIFSYIASWFFNARMKS